MRVLLLILALSLSCQAQTIEYVAPADGQRVLSTMIPADKKFVPVTVYVAVADRKSIDLGVSCSSDSTGSTTGQVDDAGNVDLKSSGDVATDCSHKHKYVNTMKLGLPIQSDGTGYMITVQCIERFLWDHCDMPPNGATYQVILSAEKHGTFEVYAATEQRIGAKSKVAKFAVLSVEHVIPKSQVSGGRSK